MVNTHPGGTGAAAADSATPMSVAAADHVDDVCGLLPPEDDEGHVEYKLMLTVCRGAVCVCTAWVCCVSP